MTSQNEGGFTLIEILVVIGIIAILAAVVLIAINPARQFAQARNAQRVSNVNAIINAIGQNMADNQGIFTCGASIPATTTNIDSGTGVDLGPCLTPDYMPALPFDPRDPNGSWTDETSYDTGYTVIQSTTTLRITVAAPTAELSETIEITR